jgi:hypothetical protein
MKPGIIASPTTPQVQQLIDAIRTKGDLHVPVFDPKMKPTDRITMSATEMAWNGISLLDVDVFFLQGFSYADPVLPPQEDRDYSVWRFDYLVTQQHYSVLCSLLSELHRRGKKVVNPTTAHLNTFMKPMMLERLRQEGLCVPEVLTTNRLEDATKFGERHEKLVWRPVTGKAIFQHFKEKQREALMAPTKPAVILAETVPGPLVRGYLFDGRPWLFLHCRPPEYDPDTAMEETLELFWDVACKEVEADLARVAQILQAPWMQVSFVVKGDRPYVYDVDTDPSYADLPKVYADALTERLAAALTGRREAFAPSGSIAPDEGHPRPTMFMRRMLDILYDFEHSKYS